MQGGFQYWGLRAPDGAGTGITSLTGDVTATGPGAAAATVAFVGGYSAANVAAGATLANAATANNTASTIVKRDGSGGFTAGQVTLVSAAGAQLILNYSGATQTTFTTNSLGELKITPTGSFIAIGTKQFAETTTGSSYIQFGTASTDTYSPYRSAIWQNQLGGTNYTMAIKAKGGGSPQTADLLRFVSSAGATLSYVDINGNFEGSVGGKTTSAIATSVNLTEASTSNNTASTLVKRDGSGNFSTNGINLTASILSANGDTLTGNGVATIVGRNTQTGLTASLGSTTLITTQAAGTYRINVYLRVSTTAVSTMTVTVTYTDSVGAVTKVFSPTGGFNGNVNTGYYCEFTFTATAGTAIAYLTTQTVGSSTYNLDCTLERLS